MSDMETVPLHTLLPKQRGIIRSVSSVELSLGQRLLEMGLTRGSSVEFVRTAPLGDPIEIIIRGYRLSLRKHEAESIMVERVMP